MSTAADVACSTIPLMQLSRLSGDFAASNDSLVGVYADHGPDLVTGCYYCLTIESLTGTLMFECCISLRSLRPSHSTQEK